MQSRKKGQVLTAGGRSGKSENGLEGGKQILP
jgi:hypothetical protein